VSDVAAPQRPETMTPRQLDRRRRVLDAVHELLAERPLRDIQVKDIADRAQVSLAAIYRYFASKEHLLAEALVDWAGRGGTRHPSGETVADRFAAVVRRGVSAYRRSPQYAELFLETTASRDPHAVECMGRLAEQVTGGMKRALVGLDPQVGETVRTTIGHAWLGGLFECVHGRTTFAELEQVLVDSARLFVEPFSPEAGGR
jgi:AcrR family transcriptional regulator